MIIMDNSNKVSRRDFLKITGAAGAAAILTAGCASDKDGDSSIEVPKGKMTYRNINGDSISLLGYGCMRWPMKGSSEGSNREIDQEMVNSLAHWWIMP